MQSAATGEVPAAREIPVRRVGQTIDRGAIATDFEGSFASVCATVTGSERSRMEARASRTESNLARCIKRANDSE